MTQYKAIAEFRANLNGGADPVTVKKGTIFSFDGMNVVVTGADGVEKKGTAPMLNKVIGEWLVPVAPEAAEAKTVFTAAAIDKDLVAQAQAVVNSSGIGSDNLVELIDKYETQSLLKDKGPTVINDDASIIKSTRRTAGESQTKNTSGVQLEDSEVGKKTTVTREQQVAKQTNYNPTVDPSEPKKQRREILSDGEGVIVKKTKEKAIFKTEMNENTRVIETETGDTIVEGAVAKETDYEADAPIEITGTSTQAQVIASKPAPKANSNPKKAADEKAKRLKQVMGDQDGVVVAKVRKDEGPKETADGFVAKLSVGKNEEKSGEVTFGMDGQSGDIDGIIGGEATFSSGGVSNAVDATEGGIDIADILDDIK
jgi:hypothetical protein